MTEQTGEQTGGHAAGRAVAPPVVTVWGRQLDLSGADDGRLDLFIAAFGHGETAPEPGVSCAGGISDPSGGTATLV